ncbi:MAG TPA: AI-2E family transporter [Pirellulales bacterium]|nr:AI-2E family transporter [Pirellulales bacterium]
MSRMASFVTLLVILLAFAALFLRVMASFLLPMFLAVLLVVMFRPVHQLILVRCRGRERLAAGLTTLAILAIVLAPMTFVLVQAVDEAKLLVSKWDTKSLDNKFSQLLEKVGLQMPPQDVVDRLGGIKEKLDALTAKADQVEVVPKRLDELDEKVHGLARDLIQKWGLDGEAPASWIVNRDSDTVRRDLRQLDEDLHSLKASSPGADEFAAALADAPGDFETLQYDLLGSPLKVRIKQLVKPTRPQLESWKKQALEYANTMALGGAQYAGGVIADVLVGFGVLIVALYYFLADGPAMIKTFMRLSPLEDRYEEQLLQEFTTVSRAVVVATLLSAVVQGLLAGVGYFFAGLGSVALLTMLTMLFALIPFVGGTLIWLPCCIWLFVEGRPTAALVLFVYCVVVVSMSDNIVKPLVLQGQSNLHPLLALLSVLGGVKAMGPIGIVVGPMVVAFLQALLKMFQTELDLLGQSPNGGKALDSRS